MVERRGPDPPAELPMIVSASRRTDIPAFFGDWFEARLAAGYCLVPNPFDAKRVTRVSLERGEVDAFVFWTRNPAPFAPALATLDRRGDPYLVLLTLTGYGPPLEPAAPPQEAVIAAARELVARIGPERLIWRYDPVILGPGLDLERHVDRFARLAAAFEGVSREVRVSFLDLYRRTRRRVSALPCGSEYLSDPAGHPSAGALLEELHRCARRHGLRLSTCAEPADWSIHGAPPGACVDSGLLGRLFGVRVEGRDRGQRPHCRCAPSRDIGVADSCLHGCAYCYATTSDAAARRRQIAHDPAGEALVALPTARRTG